MGFRAGSEFKVLEFRGGEGGGGAGGRANSGILRQLAQSSLPTHSKALKPTERNYRGLNSSGRIFGVDI